MTPVLFYGHRGGPYAAFSNWYPCTFEHDGLVWQNSEQCLMYYKSEDKRHRSAVRSTSDPGECKRLGRSVALRRDWDSVKFDIMVTILTAKFGQSPELKVLLLDTGVRPIHENCRDPWWGGGPNFPAGRDLLGKALRQVREQLRKENGR